MNRQKSVTVFCYYKVRTMSELSKSLEWLQSLFESALSENPTWLTVPELYLPNLSQMFSVSVCLCVRTYVRWVHCLLVFYYLHLWCYLSYWCCLDYVCSVVKCLELTVGVSSTSVWILFMEFYVTLF